MRYTGGGQPLELPHKLTFCCQIPSLWPGLSFDQQCYQWFTGTLNCFMDTYTSNSADQSTEATHSAAEWTSSDRFMFNPDCIFCHSDRCKKIKKAQFWTKEPLSKYEFGGRETVIRTAEAEYKIMISFHRSRDRTYVLVKPMLPNYITTFSLNDLGDFSSNVFIPTCNMGILLYLFLFRELFILQLFILESIHLRNLLRLMHLIMLSFIYFNFWHLHHTVSIHACVQKNNTK